MPNNSVNYGIGGIGSAVDHPQTKAPEVTSPSRIRDGISRAEEILSAIHDAIGALERRMDTVLQPQPPAAIAPAAMNKLASGPPASHVMGRIDLLNEGFDGAVSRLRELALRI